MVMVQVNQLATDMPRYQTTLGEKIHHVRDVVGTSSLLKNASGLLTNLGKELEKPQVEKSAPPALTPSANPAKPIPVEVHQPPPGASETLVSVLQPLVTPFTTTGIVLLFVIFFLFQREDLRDRFIKLAGSGDIERTTRAMDDAGQRLGKLFITQLVLNALFGLLIGIGLAVIGVPSAPLWGLMAMILRFVPYIGALMAIVLPLTLAAAVGDGWTMVIWTMALFALVDVVMGQIIEPFIYGKSAGLSPVAVVVSAAFWTWLWGPLGLLMSTPLTLCLVVLSRHVERLQFIDIMLGDKPALTPQQAAYQRMLTGDPVEAIEQAQDFLKEGRVTAYYEEVLIPALRLAQADAERGRLDDMRLENIFRTVSDLVEDLAEHGDSDPVLPELRSADRKIVQLPIGDVGKPVFCLPGLGRLDDCGALIVADVLKRKGLNVRVSGADAAIENDEVSSICICYLENVSKARLDYAVRKLSRQAPSARILVCLLSEAEQDAHASQPTPQPSHSLKATVAALALPKGSPGAAARN
jgi:predicted PurR-regulated permease PerM